MPAKRFVISGRVQGVGFRAYVQAVAEDLGVTGSVWNRGDHCVEAIAQCESEATLHVFETLLHNGPGHVDKVVSDPASDESHFGFRVEVTR